MFVDTLVCMSGDVAHILGSANKGYTTNYKRKFVFSNTDSDLET